MSAANNLGNARPDAFSVWQNRFFPSRSLNRSCIRRDWNSSKFQEMHPDRATRLRCHMSWPNQIPNRPYRARLLDNATREVAALVRRPRRAIQVLRTISQALRFSPILLYQIGAPE